MQAQDLALFQAALGLSWPWEVVSVEFDPERKRLDLRIDFPKGATFSCPECGTSGLKARDTEEKTWRHMDFFQHQACSPRSSGWKTLRRPCRRSSPLGSCPPPWSSATKPL